MVTIEKLEVKKGYKYLWLKHINSIDLNQHCAKCLIGDYDTRISREIKAYADLILPDAKYHYLCGVLNYYDNLHIAFREKEGETITIKDNKCEVIIRNAELLPISQKNINWKHPKAMMKSYNTCRNWQFANWVVKHEL